MRIFYAAPNTAHQSYLPNSQVWHNNLYLPLSDLGHDLVVFDFDYSQRNYHLDPVVSSQKAYIDRHRPEFGEALLNQVKRAHAQKPIDIFFSYFYGAYVEADVIRKIGDMGITTINWYCNGSYQFHLVQDIAPAYHYCLVPEKFRLGDYKRIGANPIYCQEAANPNIYKPQSVPCEFDITFVGQRYGTRPAYLQYLLNADLDVRAWGPHWQEPCDGVPLHRKLGRLLKDILRKNNLKTTVCFPPEKCGPPLSDEELINMYSRSKISLGFTSVAEIPVFGRPIQQVRLRDFEATMSGAFYLVEYFDELAEFFEPDREIVCFSSPEELKEKAKFYLKNESARLNIRDAGLKRARQEHTWHKRFEMVFAHIKR